MNDTDKGIAKRNYKDTVFRMLFSEKRNLLSLYNALNGSSYTDTEGLSITTLDNAVYMNYKNDISFVMDSELMLYEHQSTVNPNMPLRDLIYVTKVLQGITKDKSLYNSVIVKIPSPRFVVFYNGTEQQPERRTLRLSDAFEGRGCNRQAPGRGKNGKCPAEHGLELVVTVYNINFGYNAELMQACSLLGEYAQYVEQIRTYAREMAFAKAVELAVDYCIRKGILKDFLSRNRAEVIAVSIFEYDEELHIRSEKELSFQAGIEQGMKQGMEQGIAQGIERFSLLGKKLLEENRQDALRKVMEDAEYREKLYTEYNI